MLQRALAALFSLWLAVTLTFALLRLLPGDALTAQLIESGAPESVVAERRAALGLDAPSGLQYVRYLGGVLRGDLGSSLLSGQPVGELILGQLGPTLELALAALVIGVALGLALGSAAAGSRLARGLSAFALSAPVYWTGTLALIVFAAGLGVLPASGAGRFDQLVLPALTLGLSAAGGIAQATARALAEARTQDYVRTAHAKGLAGWLIWRRHLLRPALPVILAQIGVQTVFLLSGAAITETIFVRPGVGRLLLDAVLRQDYPLVQGIVVWTSAAAVGVGLVTDALATLADRRLRMGR